MVHRLLIIVRAVTSRSVRMGSVFAVGELVAWARGNRRRVRVTGRSMEPTLSDGDHLLIVAGRPSYGDIVVVAHPDPVRDTVLVKRLDSVLPSGQLVVRSDNADVGTDSRSFGPIDPDSMLGIATVCLNTLGRLRAHTT